MKCNIKGCKNEVSKEANLYGYTALCSIHLAIKESQRSNVPSKLTMWNSCSEVPNITVYGKDCEDTGRKVHELIEKGYVVVPQKDRKIGEGVEMHYVGVDGNKRADRNDFSAAQRMQSAAREGMSGLLDYAAPRRDGAVLELSYEEHHHLVCDLLAANGLNKDPQYVTVRDILKTYGIIGGAK